jgi:hypothetical protein
VLAPLPAFHIWDCTADREVIDHKYMKTMSIHILEIFLNGVQCDLLDRCMCRVCEEDKERVQHRRELGTSARGAAYGGMGLLEGYKLLYN